MLLVKLIGWRDPESTHYYTVDPTAGEVAHLERMDGASMTDGALDDGGEIYTSLDAYLDSLLEAWEDKESTPFQHWIEVETPHEDKYDRTITFTIDLHGEPEWAGKFPRN